MPEGDPLVDLWMASQLLLERSYFRYLGDSGGRRLRLLTLIELDTVTQLDDAGQTAAAIAESLRVDLATARKVINRLARRGLVRRQRASDKQWMVLRTEAADQLIAMLRRTQIDLVSSVLDRLDVRLRTALVDLMSRGPLSIGERSHRSPSE